MFGRNREEDTAPVSSVAVLEPAHEPETQVHEQESSIALALRMATELEPDLHRLNHLEAREKFLRERRSGLTTFERNTRTQIDQERNAILAERRNITFVSKMVGFKSLPLDVLSWRHDQSFTLEYFDWSHSRKSFKIHPPKLALFNGVPDVVFSGSTRSTEYNQVIHAQYEDIWELLRTHNAYVMLTTSFHGVIPDEIRKIISNPPKSEIGWDSKPMLLADAPYDSWNLMVDPTPRYLDPLVVRLGAERLWVLGQFDPTPLEQYLLDEFAQ